MIKTIVVPESNTLQISIPNHYVGKEIEVLLYSTEEVVGKISTKPNNASRFKGLFTSEEATK